ncbi:MAG: PriCT-2 domain-containing protein [Xanthobacteraceae bacterium]|uniref:PriCT-2 domain-containing protein n=1 Tax=Pseudolabrys sp. TaxID=1960880 RepID=UPI003D12461C
MSAYEFLKHLDPTADVFCFQTFPETSGATGRPFLQHRQFQDIEEALRKLNGDGHGISVCINETDGQGRKAENITRIRAVWHDNDRDPDIKFPLAPSVTVATSPGRCHHYWFVDCDWPADDKGRREFNAVMTALVEHFGADKQATDISHVMRLPGFNHIKEEPHPVIIRDMSGVRYTRAEILKHFALWPEHPAYPAYKTDEDTGQVIEIPATAPVEAPSLAPEPQDDEAGDADTPDIERIRDAVGYISAEGRDIWLKVGMGLHHATSGSEDGYVIWDEWSQNTKAKNYDPKEQKRAWDSFRDSHPEPTTIATLFHLARKFGWRDPVIIRPLADIPQAVLDVPRRKGDLVAKTMIAVRKDFETKEHKPSDRHYEALQHIAIAIQGMAEGHPSLANNIHLSCLPPGIGKTTTAIHAIRNVIELKEYAETGIIVFLARVEEIRKLVDAMSLSNDDFAVIVSENYEERNLGNPEKTKARVLFTTQQMLQSRLRYHRSFAEISDFHWNGRPREVRIWDEAISPALPTTINQYQIAGLIPRAAQEGGSKFAGLLEQTAESLRHATDRSIIDIPGIADSEISLGAAQSWYDGASDKNYCDTLFKLSGHKVRVRKDIGNAATHYEALLPDDIGPMLVLDASGQFRTLYEFWSRSRGGLVALPGSQKSYRNLTIHHWDHATGYQARREDGDELVSGIVKMVNAISAEQAVLVIYPNRKSKAEPDWEPDIQARLGRENVYFCNWGRHLATNDYRHCRHVILIGAHRYATSQCEALARGAKALEAIDDLSENDVRDTRISEMAHNIFQAACRGRIRLSVGDDCPPGCHLYVIGSSHIQAGVSDELLSQIFPGTAIEKWLPEIRLKGRAKELYELLAGCEPKQPITKWSICEKLGFNHLQQLNALLERDDLRAIFKANGVEIELGRKAITIHRPHEVMFDKQKLDSLDLPF